MQAARAIRPYLTELLAHAPERAARMDSELARQLAADDDAGKARSLLQLLEGNAVTKVWTAQFLELGLPPEFGASGNRGPAGPAPVGDGETLRPGPKYVCPVNGDVVWWRRHIGQDVPRCATHNRILVKA